jgi:hypothetical protein
LRFSIRTLKDRTGYTLQPSTHNWKMKSRDKNRTHEETDELPVLSARTQ